MIASIDKRAMQIAIGAVVYWPWTALHHLNFWLWRRHLIGSPQTRLYMALLPFVGSWAYRKERQ